jgi:acetyl esterase/lipase
VQANNGSAHVMAPLTRPSSGSALSDIEQLRAHFAALFARFGEPSPNLEFSAGQLGPIPGEWTRHSKAVPGRVLLYFHGGGYIAGSPQSHRALIGRLAEGRARHPLSRCATGWRRNASIPQPCATALTPIAACSPPAWMRPA